MDGNYIRVALVGFILKYMHETWVVNNATFDNTLGRAEERPGWTYIHYLSPSHRPWSCTYAQVLSLWQHWYLRPQLPRNHVTLHKLPLYIYTCLFSTRWNPSRTHRNGNVNLNTLCTVGSIMCVEWILYLLEFTRKISILKEHCLQ